MERDVLQIKYISLCDLSAALGISSSFAAGVSLIVVSCVVRPGETASSLSQFPAISGYRNSGTIRCEALDHYVENALIRFLTGQGCILSHIHLFSFMFMFM